MAFFELSFLELRLKFNHIIHRLSKPYELYLLILDQNSHHLKCYYFLLKVSYMQHMGTKS